MREQAAASRAEIGEWRFVPAPRKRTRKDLLSSLTAVYRPERANDPPGERRSGLGRQPVGGDLQPPGKRVERGREPSPVRGLQRGCRDEPVAPPVPVELGPQPREPFVDRAHETLVARPQGIADRIER